MTLDQIKQANEINKQLGEILDRKLNENAGNCHNVLSSWELESETSDSVTLKVAYTSYGPYQSWETCSESITLTKEELAHA